MQCQGMMLLWSPAIPMRHCVYQPVMLCRRDFNLHKRALPCRWAQDIAGLQLLPPLEEAVQGSGTTRTGQENAAAVRNTAQAWAVLSKLCGSF